MEISVVIPCQGRVPALVETLSSLGRQMLEPDRFEVIVVDNGTAEPAGPVVAAETFRFAVTVLEQPDAGAARARNAGARQARAPLLLFLDADMLADPNLLGHHLRCRQQGDRRLVAGARDSWPAARQNLFTRTVELDRNFIPGQPCTFQQVFSANLSIGRQDFLDMGGFDEAFPLSGFEDIDLAYRGVQDGMTLVCCAEAVAYHNHPVTFLQACQRARQYQRSAVLLLHKHPELTPQIDYLQDKMPISRSDPPGLIARKTARSILALPPAVWAMERIVGLLEHRLPRPALLRFFYWKVLGSYQLRGIREGLRRYGPLSPLQGAGT